MTKILRGWRRFLTVVALMTGVAALASCHSGTPTSPPAPPQTPQAPPPPPIPAPPVPPQSTMVGSYTVIISSADTAAPCSRVPELLKKRTYTADMSQTDSGLKVVLTGANFHSNQFFAVFKSDDEINFTIRPASPWDYDAFDVVERLPDGTLLIVSGVIKARRTSSGIVGTSMSAELRPNNPSDWCAIDRFEMVPRSPWDY